MDVFKPGALHTPPELPMLAEHHTMTQHLPRQYKQQQLSDDINAQPYYNDKRDLSRESPTYNNKQYRPMKEQTNRYKQKTTPDTTTNVISKQKHSKSTNRGKYVMYYCLLIYSRISQYII